MNKKVEKSVKKDDSKIVKKVETKKSALLIKEKS